MSKQASFFAFFSLRGDQEAASPLTTMAMEVNAMAGSRTSTAGQSDHLLEVPRNLMPSFEVLAVLVGDVCEATKRLLAPRLRVPRVQ